MYNALFLTIFIFFGHHLRALPPYYSLPFHKAHCGAFIPSDDQWMLVYRLYTNHIQKSNPAHRLRIPKIIHQIWLGSPVPERYARLQKTLKDKHPDWTYILWTDETIEAFHLENYQAYTLSKNYGEKSDIARYEILYRYGGLYADMDVECFDSFEPLHCLCDFYAGVSPLSKAVQIENCIIGCCSGHPIMKECIHRLQCKDAQNYSYINAVMEGTGPNYLTKIFFSTLESAQTNNFISVVLPALYFFSPDLFKQKAITTKPFLALHYWEGSWVLPQHRWHAAAWTAYENRFK